MIKSKRELAFFIQADRIMNGFPEKTKYPYLYEGILSSTKGYSSFLEIDA